MANLALQVGRALFAARSLTPVPVLAVIVAVVVRGRGDPGPGGWAIDRALDVAGFAAAALGQALRALVLGQVPEGTSGQGPTLEAATLNTRGPYAHVRNPLYLGNLLLCLGLLLIAHRPWAYALGLGFFAVQYAFIVRAEEAFLRERFGAAYDAWAATVPRWIPRLRPAAPGTLRVRFDARRALFKEHNPCAAWATAALALLAWEAWTRRGADATARLAVLGASAAAVGVAFVAIKGEKHGWWRWRRGAAGG